MNPFRLREETPAIYTPSPSSNPEQILSHELQLELSGHDYARNKRVSWEGDDPGIAK